jgi:HAD superfamily hydrolase (TIGR01450 family)
MQRTAARLLNVVPPLRVRRASTAPASSTLKPQWLDPTNAEHRHWVRSKRCFIFDIDGVVHTPAGPIAGAAAALSALRDAGVLVRFLTNNATKRPDSIVAEFAAMGITARTDEVTTSGCVAADHLRNLGLAGRCVYTIGEGALVDTLNRQAGVVAFGGADDAGKSRRTLFAEGHSIATLSPPASEVGAVVVGADGEANYYKIAKAAGETRAHGCGHGT